MKKILVVLALQLVLLFGADGKDELPPVFEITTDTIWNGVLPHNYWQMLADSGGHLSLNEITNSDRFQDPQRINIDRRVAAWWFRFTVKNAMNKIVQFGFYDLSAESTEWIAVDEQNKITKRLGGIETPWSRKTGLRNENFNFFSIAPGQQLTIYKRAQLDYFNYSYWFTNSSFTNIEEHFRSIQYGFAESVMQNKYVNDETHYFMAVHDSFLFGLLLMAAVLNLLFFLIVKERLYLFFALYVFSLGFGRFNIDSEFFQVFLRDHPAFYITFTRFIFFPIDIFLALFIRELLKTKKSYPRLDRMLIVTLIIIVILNIGGMGVDFFQLTAHNYTLSNWTYIVPIVVLHILLVVLFLLSVKKVKGDKKLPLYAILPSFIIWAVLDDSLHVFQYLLQTTFHWKANAYLNWLFSNWYLIETIIMAWQTLWFSLFLITRFGDLRKQVVQKELEKEVQRSELIEQQKVELEQKVAERTRELRQSYVELQSTQQQLVQQAKMASLGELTAGIAHEIQNPLNFVNNFSDVNAELIDEASAAINNGNLHMLKTIFEDIRENESKISHHGKRADSIVKNMLQHSHSSSGERVPTDINRLVSDYLRLAYHGFRAKDGNFNPVIETVFGEGVLATVVPQDIGRVILNIVNNAFYAVREKHQLALAGGFEPAVIITTIKNGHQVIITVKDNGNGISKNITEKIFQPFFTTKPTGQGTGLGLSLSYDIVKAHGGEIKVSSIEHEGTEFKVMLPA
jgi:signal transduction histidine kinase